MKRIALALSENIQLKFIAYAMIFMKISLLCILIYRISTGFHQLSFSFDTILLYFIGVGFLAQLVDGALGMAYGATCTSMLLGVGVPPAFATASVHTAEVFTTGVSGLSHIYFGNIDKKLFFRIVLTGVLGAMIGAYLISDVFDGNIIKPYISIYMIFLGSVIISKAFKKTPDCTTK